MFWIALSVWLVLVRLAVGAPTRPEQWLSQAAARRRALRPAPRR